MIDPSLILVSTCQSSVSILISLSLYHRSLKYRTEIAASSKEQKNQSTEQERDEDVLASLNLTLLKKSKYLREFELLHYSFSGASVFFKFSEPKQEPIEADAAAAAPVAAATEALAPWLSAIPS